MTEQLIAQKSHWRTHPFTDGLTAKFPLSYKLSSKQFANLKRGRIPEQMEDKWFIFYEKGTGQNPREGQLYFHRSWTGFLVYKVSLREGDDGGATITEVKINNDPEQYVAQFELGDNTDDPAFVGYSSEVGLQKVEKILIIPEIGRVIDFINHLGGPE